MRNLCWATVVLASADDELNEHGYIVPGLGDAGDLAFGPKLPTVSLRPDAPR